MTLVVGVVTLLLGAAGDVLLGQARRGPRAGVAVAPLADAAAACHATVLLGCEALDNRREALDLEDAVPPNAPDSKWECDVGKVIVLDEQFARLAGPAEEAAAACLATQEAAE